MPQVPRGVVCPAFTAVAKGQVHVACSCGHADLEVAPLAHLHLKEILFIWQEGEFAESCLEGGVGVAGGGFEEEVVELEVLAGSVGVPAERHSDELVEVRLRVGGTQSAAFH